MSLVKSKLPNLQGRSDFGDTDETFFGFTVADELAKVQDRDV